MTVLAHVEQVASIPAGVSSTSGATVAAVQIGGPLVDGQEITVLPSPQQRLALEASTRIIGITNRATSTSTIYVETGSASDTLESNTGIIIEPGNQRFIFRRSADTHLLLTPEA